MALPLRLLRARIGGYGAEVSGAAQSVQKRVLMVRNPCRGAPKLEAEAT